MMKALSIPALVGLAIGGLAATGGSPLWLSILLGLAPLVIYWSGEAVMGMFDD